MGDFNNTPSCDNNGICDGLSTHKIDKHVLGVGVSSWKRCKLMLVLNPKHYYMNSLVTKYFRFVLFFTNGHDTLKVLIDTHPILSSIHSHLMYFQETY